MSEQRQSDPVKTIEFMLWINPGVGIYLERMNSEGKSNPKAKLYSSTSITHAVGFVETNNSDQFRRNIYMLLNAEFLEGNRSKANLTAVRFLHVDLDFKDYPGTEKEAEERILALLYDSKVRPKGIPLPTAVWFTGGGFQAAWRLSEPISVERAGDLNQAILQELQGGPGTHDPSRLLRAPFTMNWCNEKKRAAGRVPAVAFHIGPTSLDEPPVSYSAAAFTVETSKKGARQVTEIIEANAIEPLPLPSDLGEVLPSEPGWVEAIASGRNPPGKNYASRSELVIATSVWMLSRGVAPGHVLSIITSRDLGISAHVLENPNPLKYGQRQVARAMEMVTISGSKWPVVDQEGHPVSNHPDNVRHALALLGVSAQRNTFYQTDEFSGQGLDGRDLNDIADILWSKFIRELRFSALRDVIKRELVAIAHERQYNPVLDYLDGLTWDGTPRIDTWLTVYCSADETELNREFGSKILIAGVRRVKQPGVKFDTMLVMEGPQGAGKSQVAQRLAVRDEWFCGSLDLKSDDKTKSEMLARAWIVECQELDGLNKTTQQNLKRFLSTSIDTYRRAYARDAGEYRRHCIILGTTNEGAYLRDLTGNRRMWPVLVGEIDLDRFSTDVDQLWAEAVVREAAGEAIELSPHLWASAAKLQGERMVEDAYADVLDDAFAHAKGRVSMDSVKLLLGIETARMSPMDTRRIKAVMANLGWDYGTHRLHDLGLTEKAQRKGFARGSAEERKVEYIARRVEGGVVVISRVNTRSGTAPPF